MAPHGKTYHVNGSGVLGGGSSPLGRKFMFMWDLSLGGDGKASSHEKLVLSTREEEEKRERVKGRREDEESSERK